MPRIKETVLTVGHSNQSIEEFMALLRMNGVTAVADVRSAPYSRYTPQFNREALEKSLKAAGIGYVFLGRELGARSEDRSCYENGRVVYPRLAKTVLFRQGIERVIAGAAKHRIALMCAEKEPLECHRTILVAQALGERGVAVEHILGDGRIEPHAQSLLRLLDLVKVPRDDLFLSREELIQQALTRQESKVAYVDAAQAAGAEGEIE